MINDLKLMDITHWKYIDDTTVSETIPRNGTSQIQSGANELQMWNLQNKFNLMSKNAKSFCFNSTEIEYPLIISIFLRGVQIWFVKLKF
jgi:hypothetical protein